MEKVKINSLLSFRNYWIELRLALSVFLKEPSGLLIFPFRDKLQVFLFLTFVSVLVYFNTLGHKMAYDDEQVIRKNEFVLQGVKGIPDILTHDSHFSFYKESGLKNILPGGRYRPFSEISFAIEQQLFATKHDSVPLQYVWDLNGNHRVDSDEDYNDDHILSDDDFFLRGLGFRHLINVLLFACCVGVLFVFAAKYLYGFSADVIFFACLLFTVLPIHTEVVANLKSRDELFSLLFILLSFVFAFRFYVRGSKWNLILFSGVFFLALLSKEFALVFPFLIMAVLYVLLPVSKDVFKKSFIISVCVMSVSFILPFLFHFPLLVILLISPVFVYLVRKFSRQRLSLLFYAMSLPVFIYLVLRLHATSDVGNYELFKSNIISNPYLPASLQQEWATKIFILLKYFSLSLVPINLSCDYSYSSMAFCDFGDWKVWMSLGFYAVLMLTTLLLFIKRHCLAVPLLLFFAFFLPIANIFIDIGATMGERLIFHSSVGICFLVAWPLQLFQNSIRANKNFRYIFLALIVLISASYFFISYERNSDWKDNDTLFSSDVKKYPNNVVLLSGVASSLGEKAAVEFDTTKRRKLLEESIQYVDRGLQQAATYSPLFQTLALDFYLLRKYENAISSCKAGLKVDTANAALKNMLFTLSKECVVNGISSFRRDHNDSAMVFFRQAISANKWNMDAWYNKAFVLKNMGDTTAAIQTLESALRLQNKAELVTLLNKLKHN